MGQDDSRSRTARPVQRGPGAAPSEEEQEPDVELPSNPALSTEVALRARNLHQKLDQAEQERKNAQLRRNGQRPRPRPLSSSARPGAPAAGPATPQPSSPAAAAASAPRPGAPPAPPAPRSNTNPSQPAVSMPSLAEAPPSPSSPRIPAVPARTTTAPQQPAASSQRTSKPWGKTLFDKEESSDISSIRLGGEQSGRQIIHRPDVNLLYDGSTPADGLFLTNPEIIVLAPVQSYPGQRTVIHTQNAINQYAVAANPRYFPRNREPREAGHLFVFDVMNSQHTTLGRAFPAGFPGTFRPGTLAELWKWLSDVAPSRGWRAVEGSTLQEAATRGLPIIAMAETPSGPRVAVVEPGPLGPEGKPLLASAHEPRGQRQTPEQVFGSSPVRYLAHD